MNGTAYVYIMANRRNGAIYLGSTVDLPKRAWEHRNGVVEGFTKRYGCHLLVWYEAHESWEGARQRELRMKEWKRIWKLQEIEGLNPDWDDLYDRIALP
jgi:putative endonuclease